VSADSLQTSTEEQTSEAGETLARSLSPGAVVLLYGPLGAGKTAFVRGLAKGLGAVPDDVSSPTFTLIQEYAGARATLYHVDLYRLAPEEVADLGLDELVDANGIVAVEWAERWKGRPADAIEVILNVVDENKRSIQIKNPEP